MEPACNLRERFDLLRGRVGHRNRGAYFVCLAERVFHLPSQLDGSSRIPELGGFVPTYRQNPSTVRTKPRPGDRILMFKGNDELARSRIPEFSRMASACRQDPSTVRTK